MGFRITTWNVNGIRQVDINPFGYQPWRDNRSFNAMFDTLEADIVIFQETKIQRKDLRDDMVLVPGWDCYFSLPRHKKGYSGVVIYTRNETCTPIRAEEGITGLLCPPNSTTPYRHLPDDQQIGGYPSMEQLSELQADPAVLDCEGRCVILEFPAFVLLGLYCPAARDETRDDFRQGFITLLDARVRNLVAMGKRVIVAGDLNISAGEIDSAHLTEAIRKGTGSEDEFVSSPVRRVFNHLDMKDWWSEGNIQEGLMGSDHCPVYAIFKERVLLDGNEVDIKDIVNPPGMFVNGIRQREYSAKDLLPLSGRLIPEFTQRRSIKDMFTRKPSSSFKENSVAITNALNETFVPVPSESASTNTVEPFQSPSKPELYKSQSNSERTSDTSANGVSKRARKENAPAPPPKRSKSGGKSDPKTSGKGQQSLMGFFKPKKTQGSQDAKNAEEASAPGLEDALGSSPTKSIPPVSSSPQRPSRPSQETTTDSGATTESTDETVIDPIVSKESWSKLFTKKATPRCEEHQEPCIMLTTKKPGINCGRSFWMCSRPLGPTGQSEKGTQWRCKTFIWASDWNGQDGGA
ncbi:Endonuclease/exonuclease/phosphatase [Penicillium occitanis (nom. inval.)]|nr:Endonuclease/exonuclease/phosphatase [Penicillium occitanis (nom. inval.)]PCH01071.1 hypothetical protein PENOC_050170 [Penicillium occitanis (nom. inval.)]